MAEAPQAPPPQKGPILTLRFQGGAPQPQPPVTDPTPDEEYMQHEQNRSQEHQQREVAREQEFKQQEEQGKKGAFFKVAKLASTVASVTTKVVSDVHSAGEAKVRELHHQRCQERFTRNFPELAATEQPMCDYDCKVMHQGLQVAGHFIVTAKNLCFTSDQLREIIPLHEIASAQRSIALSTQDRGPPFIMPIPAPHVIPDTVQIFTVKQQVFQFLQFSSALSTVGQNMTATLKGTPVERAFNFFDHAWRRAVQVPLPNVQYAPY